MRLPPTNDAPPPTSPMPDLPAQPASGARFSELLGTTANRGNAAPIAGDILYGADAIAVFLFGDRKHRRRVYNLVDGNGLPVFRIGVNICARKSILLEWIAAQERGNVSAPNGNETD